MSDKIANTMREIVRMLVAGQYQEIQSISDSKRLTAEEIRIAITGYPGTLVFPSDEAFQQLDKVAIQGAKPGKWNVVMPLWTDREGRSDLSLEVTLTETDKDLCLVEIDDIHVR